MGEHFGIVEQEGGSSTAYFRGLPLQRPGKEVDQALTPLLRKLGCVPKTHYPFYRLASDDVWELKNDENLLKNRSGDVSRRKLLEANVWGGFPSEIYDELDDPLAREIAAIMFKSLQEWTVAGVLEDLPLSFRGEEAFGGEPRDDPRLVARFKKLVAELENSFGDNEGIEEILKSLEELTYEVSLTLSLDRLLDAAKRIVSQMFFGPSENPASAKLLEAVKEVQRIESKESGEFVAAYEARNLLDPAIREYDRSIERIHLQRIEGPDPQQLRDFWQFCELVHEVIESTAPDQRDTYRARMYPLVIRVLKAEHTN